MMPPSKTNSPSDFETAFTQLQDLITNRKLVKEQLTDPTIMRVFELVGEAAGIGEDIERLKAVSLLGKASEISSPVAKLARPMLEKALSSPLPHSGDWGAAEDRKYLAKGVMTCNQPWAAPYAAFELATGEISEQLSRERWAQIAVEGAPNLSNALRIVADAATEDRKATKQSADTVARKLIRILTALQDPVSMADLVFQAGGRNGPDTPSVREQAATAVLDFMVQVLRLKFVAALDTEIYRASGTVIGWWKPAHPPKSVTSRTDRIVSLAMDALQMFGRQGVMQKGLRQALASAFGNCPSSEQLG